MNIKHEDYKDVLFNNKQMHHTMKTIRSKNHQLGSYELNKVSLSCFDDKDTYWAVWILMLVVITESEKMWRYNTAVAV